MGGYRIPNINGFVSKQRYEAYLRSLGTTLEEEKKEIINVPRNQIEQRRRVFQRRNLRVRNTIQNIRNFQYLFI